MKILPLLLSLLFVLNAFGQEKKILDHSAYDIWRKIENQSISANGAYIQYILTSEGYADPILEVRSKTGQSLLRYERGHSGKFSFDNTYTFFTINPGDSVLRALKRIKTKDADLPQDTLGIFNNTNQSLTKIASLQSYKIPEKGGGWLAYQLQNHPDTTIKPSKKINKENGYPLVLKNLASGQEWSFPYVQEYHFAKEGQRFAFISSGNDSSFVQGVYTIDLENPEPIMVYEGKGEIKHLALDDVGSQLTFLTDPDTTKALIRNPKLYHWTAGNSTATLLADKDADFLAANWYINEHQKPMFSENGQKLFFYTNPEPIVEDTTLLEDEIVNVEVWSYTEPRLHTQQKIDKKDDLKKGYLALYDISAQRFSQVATESIPDIEPGNEGNATIHLGQNNQPYLQSRSWEGFPDYRDVYLVTDQGEAQLIAEKVRGDAKLSPMAKFAYWYDRIDSAWFSYEIATSKTYRLTNDGISIFYDEENDSPDYPSPYGVMSWTENDEKLLIYDRFDIWEVDPTNAVAPKRLTKGYTDMVQYRYQKLDPEERFIKRNQQLLLTAFYESDKHEALVSYDYRRNRLSQLHTGEHHYSGIQKAMEADQLIFQVENFTTFPDIHTADLAFKSTAKISDANPQQAQYNWGNAELYRFTSLDGEPLEGLLIKPENFDPNKKYPMLVNFYETSSDGLHRYREPSPGRSTMSYSFYASRGYVIFNPDVRYKIGYPGESAYNCVMPGVTSLIKEGFVDKDRIGVQGHSWGGYQIAYLVTRTNLFAAAEAGAPVPNMVSAYGGIRWWTGLSRMFQYEHTQSRIGGTLWDQPLRYIENSPIFFLDKVQTPILIMHNDADGHVPWYQGIELFVALRRLGKPSWMLNYQNEPHWPLKLQHRIDFNIRLQQYFDYYLKDAPKPEWMEEGVPATQVGIDQNLELIDGN